jgi:outer membrane protein OmpA-like peptidoglycan-associated protein
MMKKLILVLFCLGFAGSACVVAQSRLEQIRNRVKEKVEQRVEAKTEEGIDKVLDKTEEAVKKTTKKNKNESSPAEKGKSEPAASAATGKTRSDVSYTKYDFIPGNEVIFEDDLQGEQKGEFPSKWDLMEGNAEIAQINGENTIALVGYTYITPLFKDHSYQLPDEFTLEFDVFIDNQEGENSIEFVNKNEELIANSLFWKDNTRFLFNWNQTSAEKTSEDSYDNSPGWHHYALSFNKRAMKVYMDSKRVANIPNIAEKPVKVKFFARGPEDNSTLHIKNIRLAKGAVPLYDKLMTDGKIVTHGITFDVGKATIKPQSMGTINEIYSILQKNASLRFSVEGHTDNTGNAASNQALSEARANAVCEKLQQMGIDAARLKARGHGMSKPMDTNNTAEGRAKNRRVEFVVLK